MDSRNKTIAVNIARNVVNYMEKQNIFVIKGYLDDTKGGNKFVTLSWGDCVEDETCVKPSVDGNRDLSTCSESEFNDFPLFTSGVDPSGNKIEDGRICLSVLAPEINNIDFKDQIKVYLTDYYEDRTKSDQLINLLKSENDQTAIIGQINPILSGSPNYESQLMKFYVVVTWHKKRDNIVLEGVISDEAFR